MNHHTLCFTLSLAMAVVIGCTLEAVPDGIECPNMRYVSIDNRTKCYDADDCGQYNNIFDKAALKAIQFGLCPPDPVKFECKKRTENESYCNYIDRSNEVICDNKPIDPASDSDYCGARGDCDSEDESSINWHGQKCIGSSHCVKGKCVRESVCGEGTHPDMYNQCVADTGDDCGSTHDNCNAEEKYCSNGECVNMCPEAMIECGAFESVRGICVDPNTNNAYCGAVEGDAKGFCKNYTTCGQNQTCTNGKCGCKLGYHEVNTGENESYCVMDTKEECGNPVTHEIENCYEIPYADVVYCHPNRGCVIQMCVDGYHLYEAENICEPDDNDNCGRHGVSCNVENAENSCVNRYCNFDCHDGFLRDPTNKFCISENIESCGTPPVNCTSRIDGWASGTCENGQCYVKSCVSGFHQYDNACEENSNDHCGNHQTKCNVAHATNTCTAEGKCQFRCDEDYRESSSGDSCVSNSVVTCGSNNTNCSETVEGWSGGTCEQDKCVASECINNYYVSGGKCLKNDDEHCGSATKSCVIDHGSGHCIDNECHVECETGYHSANGDTACEENTVENCGSTGHKCRDEITNWADGSCSASGKCIVGLCTENNHVYAEENKCEANSTTNCGGHGKACGSVSNGSYSCTSGECVLRCNSNYHVSADKKYCNLDSLTECGNSRTNCTSLLGWDDGNCTDGECVATSCKDLFYLDDNSCNSCGLDSHVNKAGDGCDPDGPEACGPYGVDCTRLDGWGNGYCGNGNCYATSCRYNQLYHGNIGALCAYEADAHNGIERGFICPFNSEVFDETIWCREINNCLELLYMYGTIDTEELDEYVDLNGYNVCYFY